MSHVLTEDQKKEAIRDYQGGRNSVELAERYGVKNMSLRKLLRRHGVVLRNQTWKLTPEQRGQAVEDYAQGKSSAEVGKDLGVDAVSVLYFLKKAGIAARNLSDSHRKCTLNEHAFDVLTPEAAYWLGFLMTDGNVYHNDIQVNLSAKDVGHLEKLRTFLGSNRAISYGKARVNKLGSKFGNKLIHSNRSAILTVSSPRLIKKLAKFGIVPRKTGIEGAPKSLAFNLSFWRGCVDGDGSLGLYRTVSPRQVRPSFVPRISLCGTKKLVGQFKTFAESLLGSCSNKVRRTSTIWNVCFDGQKADKLIYVLYNIPGEIALDRKQAKAYAILLREIPESLSPGRDIVTGRWLKASGGQVG